MKATKVFWDGKRCIWKAKYLDTESGYKTESTLGRPDDPVENATLYHLAVEAAPASFRYDDGLRGNFEIERDVF